MATQATVPPLCLGTARQRYPLLFREYTYLSDREKKTHELMDVGAASAVDSKTGLCTTIAFTDFNAPLAENPNGGPMKASSDANKFAMFLWKMLDSCESGSIGGDACRQFDVLNSAVDDVLAMHSVAARFEHLLGWTTAAAHHGLHALLYRGDPDRNQSLFKAAADAWKKVYETNTDSFVTKDLRSFAVSMCESFQRLLKDAKKEYGDYAKYTFNFIKKPRVKKSPAVKTSTVAVASAAAASTNGGSNQGEKVTVLVTKPSKDSTLGILIQQVKGTVRVQSIAPGGLFAGTNLKVGMVLETLNGEKIGATVAEAIACFKAVEGPMSIAAVIPNTAAAAVGAKENAKPAKKNLGVLVAAADDEPKPWEEDGFVPVTKSGKQKSPNVIRNELQKYIDQCKADGTMTQTRIIEKMGVNNNTFRRYMNPKTYKDQWSATQNGTYWAAARLLAEVKYEHDTAKKSGAKRKAAAGGDNSAKKAKVGNSNNGIPSKMTKAEAIELINRINAVEGVPDDIVYDSCPQLGTKIKAFLQRDGMTKANLLKALGNLNSNSMNRFLSGKGQDQCANVTYKAGYVFFEKLRILEVKEKSKARLKNEQEQPSGFSLTKSRGGCWYIVPRR